MQKLTNDTPIAMLTVGQLKEVLGTTIVTQTLSEEQKVEKRYVYGIGVLRICLIARCRQQTESRHPERLTGLLPR